MNRERLASIRAAVGGETFLGLPGYAAITPLGVILSVFLWRSTQRELSLGEEVAAQGISIIVCWLILVSTRKFLFKQRHIVPARIFQVLLFGAFLGAAKFYSAAFFLILLGHEMSGAPDFIWSLNSVAFGAAIAPALAAVEFKRRELSRERDLLISERVLRGLAPHTPESLGPIVSDLREILLARKEPDAGYSAQDYASRITDLVENQVRPLSRKLWAIEQKKIDAYEFGSMLRAALRGRPFSSVFIPIIAFAGGLATGLAAGDFAESLARYSMNLAISFLLFSAGNLLVKRFRRFAQPLFWFVLLSTPVVVVQANVVLFGGPIYGSQANALGLVSTWILMLSISYAVGNSVISNKKQISIELSNSDLLRQETAVTRAAQKIANKDLANYLHSTVQNRLLSSAMKIGKSEQGSAEEIEATAELASFTESIESEWRETVTKTSSQVIEEIIERWRGFVEISVNGGLSNRQISPELTGYLVEEAVSNAVRHGRAKKLTIEITDHQTHSHIQFTDDGYGPKAGKSKLGTSLFESATAGNWSLAPGPSGGSVLTLNIPRPNASH